MEAAADYYAVEAMMVAVVEEVMYGTIVVVEARSNAVVVVAWVVCYGGGNFWKVAKTE